ncbi:MAG: AAA family ATPase [Verrucomicrobiaceae bacterium]
MRIPELILLIGIPAAGKSTFAREQLFDTHVRLNLDMLRTRVKEMRLLEACLKSRISCMVDNTNITRAGRARSIPLAKTARFRVTGYCLETSLETALRQNLQRERHVPNYAIEARHNDQELPTLEEEFDELHRVQLQDGGFVVQAFPA